MVGWTGRSGRCRAHDLHETVHILYVYGLNFEYIRLHSSVVGRVPPHHFASDHHSIEKRRLEWHLLLSSSSWVGTTQRHKQSC
jgi:hypothetical protein